MTLSLALLSNGDPAKKRGCRPGGQVDADRSDGGSVMKQQAGMIVRIDFIGMCFLINTEPPPRFEKSGSPDLMISAPIRFRSDRDKKVVAVHYSAHAGEGGP
jgi:hypothetical protein